jgi:hypothetical protein
MQMSFEFHRNPNRLAVRIGAATERSTKPPLHPRLYTESDVAGTSQSSGILRPILAGLGRGDPLSEPSAMLQVPRGQTVALLQQVRQRVVCAQSGT